MDKITQVLLIALSIVFLMIAIPAWSTFMMLSVWFLYVLFLVAMVAMGFVSYRLVVYQICDTRDRVEVTRQNIETTENLRLDNQQKGLELSHYGQIITSNLDNQALYVKKMLGTTFDKLPQMPQMSLPEGIDEIEGGIPRVVPLDYHVNLNDHSLSNFFIGVTYDNKPIFLDFQKMIHILVVGTTGSGKSVLLNNMLTQLIYAREPVKVDLIDLGSGTFDNFHLPYAETIHEAEAVVRRWKDELARRRSLYQAIAPGYDDEAIQTLSGYNRLADEPLPYTVLFVEEGLAITESKIMQSGLKDIVSQARKYGLVIVFVAQSAKSSVLDTMIRDNFKTRIGFHTMEKSLSRVIFPDFDLRPLGVTEGRGVVDFKNQRFIVQTPLIESQQMIQAGYVARDQNITEPIERLTVDAEATVIDLGQFTREDDLPFVPKGSGSTKERIAIFFDTCDHSGIDPFSLEETTIIRCVQATEAGYNYRLVREVKESRTP